MTVELKRFFGRLRRRFQRGANNKMVQRFEFEHRPLCECSTTTSTCSTHASADASLREGATTNLPCYWIYLDEELDSSDMPLIRNCSCRGTPTDAQISCIINYAEHKGHQYYEDGHHELTEVCRYFRFCPNCNQEYPNHVKSDVSKAMVTFVEGQLHDGTSRATTLRILALVDRLLVLCTEENDEEGTSEGQVICSKLVFLLNSMDSAMKACAYFALGCFQGSIDSLEKAKNYLETARNILQDKEDGSASNFPTSIGITAENTSIDVDSLRIQYEVLLQKCSEKCCFGKEPSYVTVNAGRALSKAFQDQCHCTKSTTSTMEGSMEDLLSFGDSSSTACELEDIECWFHSI